jgi:hypothetical protein
MVTCSVSPLSFMIVIVSFTGEMKDDAIVLVWVTILGDGLHEGVIGPVHVSNGVNSIPLEVSIGIKVSVFV